MPITATCPGCAKQLNVRDEFIGRRLKCPQCGNAFTADASTAAPAGAAPRAGRATTDPRTQRTQRLHVSPGIIILALVAITVPTIFFVWRIGPGRVRAEWSRLQPIASDDVKDVVTRGIQSYMSQRGLFDPGKPHGAPHALDVTFIISPMPWSMPRVVGFAGSSTQGAFVGKYRPHDGEIEADVELGGLALPGAGVARRGDAKIHVTGRNSSGNVTVEVDGKPAELVYRRGLDDD